MQTLKNKLRSTRGETLVEVLIAMLIVALATMLLAAMVHAAAQINTTTRVRDEHFYAELSAADTLNKLAGSYGERDGTGTYQVTVQVLDATGVPATGTDTKADVTVDIYGGDHLTSYRKQS